MKLGISFREDKVIKLSFRFKLPLLFSSYTELLHLPKLELFNYTINSLQRLVRGTTWTYQEQEKTQ